jgi:hypothetical protein
MGVEKFGSKKEKYKLVQNGYVKIRCKYETTNDKKEKVITKKF